MDDSEILRRIKDLTDEEHLVRVEAAGGDSADEQVRIRRLEEALDQCWDLLRQRRARREAGKDPDDAQGRPVSEVESYLQ